MWLRCSVAGKAGQSCSYASLTSNLLSDSINTHPDSECFLERGGRIEAHILLRVYVCVYGYVSHLALCSFTYFGPELPSKLQTSSQSSPLDVCDRLSLVRFAEDAENVSYQCVSFRSHTGYFVPRFARFTPSSSAHQSIVSV
jgi:hypothetical protein